MVAGDFSVSSHLSLPFLSFIFDMRFTFQFVFIALLLLVSLLTAAGLFATSVQLEPAGVKRYDRERYDEILANQRLAQQLKRQTITDNGPIAEIVNASHDFGRLDPHSQHTHSFEIKNIGKSPLTLEVGDTSCKCTVGKLTDGIVPAGQSTFVTLTWNTGYRADQYEQAAIVRTNDLLHPTLTLRVQGEIRAELIVPESVALNAADPGEPSHGSFTIYSQLFEDFTILDVRSDLAGIQWDPEVVPTDSATLADADARSALGVRVTLPGRQKGKFSGSLDVEVLPSGATESITREVSLSGRVRAPINFYGAGIHPVSGLEIGTLSGGKDHHFYLTVRSRGQSVSDLAVLDVEPKIVRTKLTPTTRQGEYRLRLTIPGDADTTLFNRDDQQGYVQVGDPNSEDCSNWFPINGGIVQID